MPEEISLKTTVRSFPQSLEGLSEAVSTDTYNSALKNKRIEANKVNSTGLLEISNTTVNHLLKVNGKELPKDVSKDNRLKENWIITVKDLIEAMAPSSWIKWILLMKLADKSRFYIGSGKDSFVVQYLSDLVYYAFNLEILCGKEQIESCESMAGIHIRLDVPVTIDQVENWTNFVGVKQSAKILRDQEDMAGNYLLNNNLRQAYMESCPISDPRRIIFATLANLTSQIEVITGRTTARSFTQNYWQGLSKFVSRYVLKNWPIAFKDLKETPGSWIKWNMTKLVEEPRFNIIFYKGFLIIQSLRDLVCYVVDLSDVPKCGSFNPYGNEQMDEMSVETTTLADYCKSVLKIDNPQAVDALMKDGYPTKEKLQDSVLHNFFSTDRFKQSYNFNSGEAETLMIHFGKAVEETSQKEKKRTTLVQDTKEIKKMKMFAYSIDSTHHFDLSFPALSSQNSTCLYFRQPAIHLIEELSQDIRAMMIQGPPGSGKSSITWAWACEQDYVCWIHLDELKGTVCWKDASDSWSKATYSNDSLSAFVDSSKSRVLILDGIVKEKHEILLSHAVANWLDVDVGRKLIIVCSLQYVIKTETLKVHNYKTFQMPSWSLEEYTSAYSHVMMKHSITTEILPENEVQDEDEKVKDEKDKDKEKLQDKFFVAGGSARWMFQFTVNEVIADIEMHVSRIGSDLTLLMNGLLGERSNTSISHLFCVFNTKEAFIVSEFATRSIAEKCEAAFLIQARNSSLAISNPTFDGWIFEAEFIYKLRSKEITVLFESSALALPVASKYRFCSLPDIVDVKLPASLDNVWFVPSKWNQACFDVVQALPDGGFRFIQVTKSLEHTLKLKYIVLFLDRFIELKREVKALEIWFVVPNEPKYDTFRPKIAEGNLGVFRDRLKKNGDLQYFLYGFERL